MIDSPKTADDRGRLFEVISAHASVALFVVGDKQQCVLVNAAAEELSGYTLQQVRGRALHDVLLHKRPDGTPYPQAESPMGRALPQNRERGEEVFVHKDGHFYDVAFCVSPIREAGVIVGAVIEVQDISQRKRMDAQVEAERSLLNTVLEVAPLGICVADASGRLVRLNPAMKRVWGDAAPFAASVAEYRAYRGWFGVEEDGRPVEPHEWPMSRALAGEALVGPEIFRIEPFNAPGSRRIIALSAASVRDASGKIIAAVAMAFDITDMVAAQASVRDGESRFRALAVSVR
ncbi:MAG: PAS domain S-box protein [Planctomycetes bacterium]|nr:PAS domain S-box protein [Planctomycetota bacterium]